MTDKKVEDLQAELEEVSDENETLRNALYLARDTIDDVLDNEADEGESADETGEDETEADDD